MTVDECIDRVIDLTLQGLKPLSPGYSYSDAVADRDRFAVALRALILTESERAAAVCLEVRGNYDDKTLVGRAVQRACEVCHARILRTSPGKGGA